MIKLPIVTFKGANNGTVSEASFATLVILMALLTALSLFAFFFSFEDEAMGVSGRALLRDSVGSS